MGPKSLDPANPSRIYINKVGGNEGNLLDQTGVGWILLKILLNKVYYFH
jgi:hypothetical protein